MFSANFAAINLSILDFKILTQLGHKLNCHPINLSILDFKKGKAGKLKDSLAL